MAKIILLARVSTQAQDYTMQVDEMRKVATSMGYSSDDQIEVKGKESAIKLEEEQRETLNEMKDLIEQHPEVNHVMVFAIDRLARRVSIVLNVKDWLTSRKINLTFLHPAQMSTLQADGTPNPATEMSLMLLAYGAQQEMNVKQARFKAAKDQLRKQKKIASGRCLYGYTKGKDRIPVIVEEEAEAIRKAYMLLASDDTMTATRLDDMMVELGYWKAVTQKYNSSRVCQIIHNPAYMGGESGGVLYPAIVDQDTWEKATARLKANRKNPKSQHKYHYFCDQGLIKTVDSRPMHPIAKDWTYSTRNDVKPIISISLDIADLIAVMTTTEYHSMLRDRQGKEGVENARNTITQNLSKIESLQANVEELEASKKRAFKGYMMGGVDDETYQGQVDELNSKIAKLKARIVEVEMANSNLEAFIERYDKEGENRNWFQFESATFEQKKSMIREVIKTIWVERTELKHYKIQVELTDIMAGIVGNLYGLQWTYTSVGGEKKLWNGRKRINLGNKKTGGMLHHLWMDIRQLVK